MNVMPYSLLAKNENSNEFYTKLSMFTDIILNKAEIKLNEPVTRFIQFNMNVENACVRTYEEYLLEYIMIGVLWRNYGTKAASSKALPNWILRKLFQIRGKNEALKPYVDKVRGYLAYTFLNNSGDRHFNFNLVNFGKLLTWLSSTGEFKEEIKRLETWQSYFSTCQPGDVCRMLWLTYDFSYDFYVQGLNILGEYTKSVNHFWQKNEARYRYKEDYFFAGRQENEYFLNMFGAEIMNRQLKPEFEQTPSKAVLLPTCMRNKPAAECQAKWDGRGMVCAKCSADCNIGEIARAMSKESAKSYLIPHSSDFSKFLKHWADQREVALVGVACVLNLLTGGYEMKRLNIPSQCVFLDYCGCKKHWDRDGVPTKLNVQQLSKVLGSTKYVNGLKTFRVS